MMINCKFLTLVSFITCLFYSCLTEAKSTFLPDWQETDIGSEGDHNKDENYCIEAEDIDGSKFYHKATSCPVPKVFDETCPTDPDYISKCYCPEEYKLTCDAPLRGNSQYSCDGLWASCCDTTCPAGSDSNTSCYGTDVKVTVGYNGCGDACSYCRPCNEDCTISCGYNQDATPTGSYSECGTACVSCSDRCSPAPSESGCPCGSYSDCSDGCGGLRTCCYACPTPDPEPEPTPTPTPQPDPTPTPRPDPTPTPTPTPDPTPSPSCTYSTTAASCSSQCKNVGSSSCTRNGTTYYNGCGSSKCSGSQTCQNGSCKDAAPSCTYTTTAASCSSQCKNVGSSSCTKNGTTYYNGCGSSKCSGSQTCQNGSCKDPAPSCTYTTTAASCSSQCKNVGSQSCSKNGTTYYNGCGSSKCSGSQSCKNGSCIDCSHCNDYSTAGGCYSTCVRYCERGTSWDGKIGGKYCARR